MKCGDCKGLGYTVINHAKVTCWICDKGEIRDVR